MSKRQLFALGILIGLILGATMGIISVSVLPAKPPFMPGDEVAIIFNTASVHNGIGCMENDYAVVSSVGATGEKEWFKYDIITVAYPEGNLAWMPLNLVLKRDTTPINLCPPRNIP